MICIMKCCFTYFSKPFVSFVIISFIASILSINLLASVTCKAESKGCCCKESSDTYKLNLIKKCCCEIKEASEQSDKFIINTTDTFNKHYSFSVKTNSERDLKACLLNSFSGKIISFHSPPREDICIFNSILRI